MANAIELIQRYSSKAWDKVYKAESCSSVLDGEKDLLKFTGTKTVKIAKFSASGLSNYQRANIATSGDFAAGDATDFNAGNGYGYKTADMALVWETFEMQCDRAAQYRIDLMDNEETNALAVGTCTTEVSRTIMIPEIDAYCFSKLATEYAGKTDTATIVYSGDAGVGEARLSGGIKLGEGTGLGCRTVDYVLLSTGDALPLKSDLALCVVVGGDNGAGDLAGRGNYIGELGIGILLIQCDSLDLVEVGLTGLCAGVGEVAASFAGYKHFFTRLTHFFVYSYICTIRSSCNAC